MTLRECRVFEAGYSQCLSNWIAKAEKLAKTKSKSPKTIIVSATWERIARYMKKELKKRTE